MRLRSLITFAFIVSGCLDKPVVDRIPVTPSASVVTIPLPPPSASAEPEDKPLTFPEDFPYKLGHSNTLFNVEGKFKNRGKNIWRGVELINAHYNGSGVLLLPGDEFSFNDVVGPRTGDRGFLEAPIIAFGEMVPGIGGGTCQASSTTFSAALEAGMDITYRRPHSRPAGYIKHGADATVSFGPECEGDHRANVWNKKNKKCAALDLRFKNPYDFPVLVRAETAPTDKAKHTLTITFYGTERGPIEEVRMQFKTYSNPTFERRLRVTNRWKPSCLDCKKQMQAGKAGTTGALFIHTKYRNGRTASRRIDSVYKPQHEIWEVGLGYNTESPPWEE